jgi:hypothetical protein
VLIEGSECGLSLGIIEEEEPPVLLVATTRCPYGSVEEPGLHIERDGVRPHPPHGACRIEGFSEIHGWAHYAGSLR